MLRSGTIHAISQAHDEDGSRTAVIIRNSPGKGILVWAGLLLPSARQKAADQIMASDYVRRQIVSFACWTGCTSFRRDIRNGCPARPGTGRVSPQ